MRVTVTQPNYLPWLGFFDLLRSVDAWIILEDVQYTSRDWRNRNRIKTPQGVKWLSIPVLKAAPQRSKHRLVDAKIATVDWAENHLELLRRSYRNAEYFHDEFVFLTETLRSAAGTRLTDVTIKISREIMLHLGIKTQVIRPQLRSGPFEGTATARLVDFCSEYGATKYVTGPRGLNYMENRLFHDQQIGIEVFEYPEYAPYKQLWGSFVPQLSIADQLLNMGRSQVAQVLNESKQPI